MTAIEQDRKTAATNDKDADDVSVSIDKETQTADNCFPNMSGY